VKALGDPGRVTAIGKADADPLAPNTSEEGRDQNRRIESCCGGKANPCVLCCDSLAPLVPDFIGVLLVSLLIWFFGPFLGFLESWVPRAIIIAVLFLIWAGVNFFLDRRRKKNDDALVAGVTATAPIRRSPPRPRKSRRCATN